MEEPEYKKNHRILSNKFTQAHLYFYTWKGLQNKEFKKYWERSSYFWNAILSALFKSFIQSIANLYDKKDDVISIYRLQKFIQIERIL
ncbi:MAG: hypothetical protein GF347_01020 [Candidatus Moranbacteria bacterium]|nr:hypothetical protein [Candidatus Moranbacteria bacterium]